MEATKRVDASLQVPPNGMPLVQNSPRRIASLQPTQNIGPSSPGRRDRRRLTE